MMNRILIRAKSTLHRVPNQYNTVRSGSNVKPVYEPGLHHHKAPSVPGNNVTPDVFLPATDARKGLNLTPELESRAPELSVPSEQQLNLTPVEVREIQKLRQEDPEKWTRKALAEKFGISPFTVSLVADVNNEWKKEMDGRLQWIKNRWSEGRSKARADRQKRKVSWYRDE